MTDTTHTPFRGNAFPGIETAAGYVFGELVKLAMPHLKGYHSDLYNDAVWIREHVSGPNEFTFFWSVGESGTFIGTDSALVLQRKHAYHVSVSMTGRGIEVRIQDVA